MMDQSKELGEIKPLAMSGKSQHRGFELKRRKFSIYLYREKAILDMIARVIGVVCEELRC